MITRLGEKFTDLYKRNMPDAFVFALLLTLITAAGALIWTIASPLDVIKSWYQGFWMLLEFGMQMVLLIITGYSIALSPAMARGIDHITRFINKPWQVYYFVILIGSVLCFISWGWIVITAILARELALRVKGIHYPFLIACVYISNTCWVNGLSSSIPLLLNTDGNFLIELLILSHKIPINYTLGSLLNISIASLTLCVLPLLMVLLRPKEQKSTGLIEMLSVKEQAAPPSIKEEALRTKLQYKAMSDYLNNSSLLQYIIALTGLVYIIYHFSTKGLDLNLNIMIFVFLIMGLFLHQTPVRYGISMKRASTNISGILFQYPFYAGIMGIMIHTGLGSAVGQWMASAATVHTYPFYAFTTGAIINFAIPSAGGEFAVIGPSVINAVKGIAAGIPGADETAFISRAALSIAYGESLSNALQPFYLLLILPVMGQGIKIQARDIMGYLVIPFIIFFILESMLVMWMPL